MLVPAKNTERPPKMNLVFLKPTLPRRRSWLGFVACLAGMSAVSCGEPPSPDEQAATFAEQRRKMVDQQFSGFGRDPVTNKEVLQAMAKVERHRFVPASLRRVAYADRPLPIGHGQTISQPYIVALMTEKLEPKKTDRVLEIGTGSGYQAAVLAELVDQVYTIEIVEPLGKKAAETLEALDHDNVHVRIGDGYKGWPEEAPFDAIIVTAAPEEIPQPLVDQLREGGRMMIPVGSSRGLQELILLEKKEGKIEKTSVLDVRFVPMTGEAAKKE